MLVLIGCHSSSQNSNEPSEFALMKVSVWTVVLPTFYHRTNPFGDGHGGIPPLNLWFYSSCTWPQWNPKGLAGLCACFTDICVRAFDVHRENLKFLSAFTLPINKTWPLPSVHIDRR